MKQLAFAAALVTVVAAGAVALAAQPDRRIIEDDRGDGGQWFSWGHVQQDGGRDTTLMKVWGMTGPVALFAAPCASNACTRPAPTGATEGVELGGVASYQATVCVDAGTLADGGACQTWLYNPNAQDPALDWSHIQALDFGGTGGPACISTGVRRNSFRTSGYRLAIRCVSLGVTAGGAPTLITDLQACTELGCAPK